MWANKNGTKRNLAFEKWWPQDDGDGDGNVPPQPQWASLMEVWGKCEQSDADMVHGWISANRNLDALKPDFQARVHGDGISGQRVWISCADKPRANLTSTCWCKVVPFAPCIGSFSTYQHGPNCWQTSRPNQGTRLPCQTRTGTS